MEKINRIIIATSIVGVLLSTYALYVEMAAEGRPGYKALCDISERASCSRVLTSKYSKGLGLVPKASFFEVPNCIYGVIFYCIMILLGTFDNKMATQLQLTLALISVATSVYLAYLLAFVLHDFCIVCVSTYLVNATLAIVSFRKMVLLSKKNK